MSGGDLVDQDHQILRLAATPPRSPGKLVNAIADLGLTEVRYYQRLNTLLDSEAALAAYPITVNRLRRLRRTRTLGGNR